MLSLCRIVTSYGHCGATVLAENMPIEVSDKIIPGTGYISQEELDKLPDVHPANNFTVEEKLDIAILMAESLADIHNFVGGVIVHGDIHPVQWLRSPAGDLKLNDFNNAEILTFNPKSNTYCKKNRGSWGGMYRSPEEFYGYAIDEQVDIYSFGNNIYTLITGLWPFYVESDYEYAYSRVMKGIRPFVDERYVNRSYIEGSMIKLMRQCWKQSPEQRPSASEVVRTLREIRFNHSLIQSQKHGATK
jgi:serine/threonine protein kinase